MDESKEVVQSGPEAPKEPAPEPQKAAEPKAAEPIALTEERIRQIVSEASQAALEKGKDLGRRELQGQQDRNRAELSRTRQAYEGVRAKLAEADPDAAKDLELNELRTQREETEARRQQEEFHNNFVRTQTEFIKGLGLDPADKRIDWAEDASDYLAALQRIQGSVAKVQQEAAKTMQAGFETKLKALEDKVNKVASQANLEANSVSTGASRGAPEGSDTDFMRKFADGTLPMTKENIARVNKLQEQS